MFRPRSVSPSRNAEQILSRDVSREHHPFAVGGQDRGRTALRQQPELLLRLAPQRLLDLDACQVLDHQFVIAHQHRDEQAGKKVRPRPRTRTAASAPQASRSCRSGSGGTKQSREAAAVSSGTQHDRRQHYGKDVQGGQRHVAADHPVQPGRQQDQDGARGENFGLPCF